MAWIRTVRLLIKWTLFVHKAEPAEVITGRYDPRRSRMDADHELALIENTQRIIKAEDNISAALIGGAL